MKPYFSIIIPVYNKQNHIKSTLKDVLKQSFTDFEIIVINDGSTDLSLEEINRIKDPRIKIFSTTNHGVSYARNFGVIKALSDRIVFLDADDSWKFNHLQNLYDLYVNFPDCGLYCTAYQKQLNQIIIPSTYNGIPKAEFPWQGVVSDFFEASSINCIAWTSAVSVPKSCFNTVKGFNENITMGAGEDTDLWIKLALKYPVAFTNEITATHNLHAQNRLSNTIPNNRNFINLDAYSHAAETWPALKKYLDLNRLAIGLQYKLAKKPKQAKYYIEKIDKRHLNLKQKLIINCNHQVLKQLIKIQNKLQKNNVFLSVFK